MNTVAQKIIFPLFLLVTSSASAVVKVPDGKGDRMQLSIHVTGTVQDSSSCKFSADNNDIVDLGDYQYANNFDGTFGLKSKAPQKFSGSVVCTGTIEHTRMRLSSTTGDVINYNGTDLLPVKYDSDGMRSKSLAIEFFLDDKPQNVNQWFDIDYKNQPQMKVALTQTGDGQDFADNAAFSANATLMMEFE